MASFYIPEKYGGKSLRQLQQETGASFRPDLLARGFGIDENTPLKSGQAYNLIGSSQGGYDISPSAAGSEYNFLSNYFTPQDVYQQQQNQAFTEEQRARGNEFLGRFREEVPAALQAAREALGLPQAFETYRGAGETARDIGAFVEDLPDSVRQALEGKGLSAGQIAGRTSKELRELSPTLTAAQRALESSQSGLSSLLSQYQTETAQVLTPYELEANMINAQSAQEFDLFKSQLKNDLDREVAQIQEQGAMDRAQLERAAALAELEEKYEGVSFTEDLGDRIVFYDRFGSPIREEAKGLAPKRDGGGLGNLGTLADQRQSIRLLP